MRYWIPNSGNVVDMIITDNNFSKAHWVFDYKDTYFRRLGKWFPIKTTTEESIKENYIEISEEDYFLETL